MNILIVNAFGNSPSGKAKFSSFTNLIKSLFKTISKKSGVDNFYYTYKDPSNIDDFIYDPEFNPNEGTKTNISNKKNFDKIDIVFIDGTERYLPWEDAGYKLSLFIRLCKVTNKILYAGGVALEVLIYYLATGSHNEMNFINSKGEIQSIEEIQRIPSSFLNELKKNDKFLDFVTGDVLEYHTINQSWVPIVNIGLHKQLTAEKFMSRGQFVLPDKYEPRSFNARTIVSNCKELKLTVKKQFLSHWIVKRLPVEFVVYSTLSWFPHYFNVSYEKFQFKTICESMKGPFIIEHENTIGVAFHAMSSYKESVMILENFIRQSFKSVQEKLFQFTMKQTYSKEKELPNMFKSYRLNDEQKRDKIKDINEQKKFRPLSSVEKVNNSRPFSKVLKVKKVAAHCGFGFNNRNMIFVEDNSINQKPISCYGMNYIPRLSRLKPGKVDKVKQLSEDFSQTALRQNEQTRISQLFKIGAQSNTLPQVSLEVRGSKDFLNSQKLAQAREEMNKHEQNAEDYLTFIDKEKMDEDQMLNYYKKMRRDICQKLEEISQASEYRLNKIDVKQKLPEKKKTKRVLRSGYLSIKTASNFYSAKKKHNMSNTHTSIF